MWYSTMWQVLDLLLSKIFFSFRYKILFPVEKPQALVLRTTTLCKTIEAI